MMSGELLFLLYAFPCATTQLARGVITQKEYELLDRWATENPFNLLPMVDILEKAFPEAVARLLGHAQNTGCDPWSLENVRDFWRNYHNYKVGNCNVRKAVVLGVTGLEVFMQDGTRVFNLYKLKLITGLFVYIHQNIVIEVE